MTVMQGASNGMQFTVCEYYTEISEELVTYNHIMPTDSL